LASTTRTKTLIAEKSSIADSGDLHS